MSTLDPSKQNRFHGLSFDTAKNKWRLKITVDRGPKIVGKRLQYLLRTSDCEKAIIERDGIIRGLRSIGLTVTPRFQKRRRMPTEKPVLHLPAPVEVVTQPETPKERSPLDYGPVQGRGTY